MKTGKHSKYTSYRKIFYHRFFVGLLLFIVVVLVSSVLFNVFSSSSPKKGHHEPVKLSGKGVPVVRFRDRAPQAAPRFDNCSYWDCFNVYRCGRGGHEKITIYIYPLRNIQTEFGAPVSRYSREFYLVLDTIKRSKYYTPNPEEACLLVPSIDTLNQNTFSSKHVGQALQSLK